jgi:sporulation and spore germination protein
VSARLAVGASLVALLALAGCGVPTGGRPDAIPPSSVPFGLASAEPSAPSATSAPVHLDEPRIYLVEPNDALVPIARQIPEGRVRERLAILLKYLAAGPTRMEKRHQVSTALPPDIVLRVRDVTDDRVTIDIGGPADAPSGKESRRAVAQIVLTATSLPEVHGVLLTSDGTPIEAPLPSGELTSAPLTALDYTPMLHPPTPSAVPAPGASAVPFATPASPTS